MSSSAPFSTVPILCDCRRHPVPNPSRCPHRKPTICHSSFRAKVPWQHFLSARSLFRTVHRNGATRRVSGVCHSLSRVLKVPPRGGECQRLPPFQGRVIAHLWTDGPRSVYPLVHQPTLGLVSSSGEPCWDPWTGSALGSENRHLSPRTTSEGQDVGSLGVHVADKVPRICRHAGDGRVENDDPRAGLCPGHTFQKEPESCSFTVNVRCLFP